MDKANLEARINTCRDFDAKVCGIENNMKYVVEMTKIVNKSTHADGISTIMLIGVRMLY